MSTNGSTRSIPDHVPPDLVVDFDIYNIPNGHVDPQAAWRCFQVKGPFVFSPHNGGYWIPTVGEDVARFYRDYQHFSSREVAIPSPPDRMYPMQADPPEHGQHRANIQGMFSPTAVRDLEPRIREMTIARIESFRELGECEFVSDFALQIPLDIFLQMMGLPLGDRLTLRTQVEKFLKSRDPAVKGEAHLELHKYLDGWIEKRIANPGDDGVTRVTRSTINGRPYTRDEMLGTLTLLLHAGLDTVANMMSFIALHLARSPADRNYIRHNGDKMSTIIQELLRRFAGPNIGRIVAMDWTYKGVFLKQGDRIILPVSFYNMDEDKIADPDRVDLTRNARHITFGSGVHACAGAALARSEISIFLHEWLQRIPEFTTDPARPVKMEAGAQNTVSELWLRWS